MLSSCKGSPPLPPPQANKTFIRPSYGMLVVNPLIRPCFLRGGGIGGYPSNSHDVRHGQAVEQEERA